MGLNASNQFTENTLNSLSSVVNSTTNQVLQDIETECNVTNTFEGFYGIYPTKFTDTEQDFAPCPTTVSSVNVSQYADATCSIKGGLTSEINEKLTTTLTDNINNWITQNAKQNNGWLSIGINIAAEENINQTQISSRISNNISSNLSQKCETFLAASNQAKLYFCGNYPDGIVIAQKGVASSLTNCMLQGIITAITNDSVLNDIVNKTSQQVSQTNEGLGSLLKWIIIAAIVIAVVVIIGILIYFISSGGKGKKPEEVESEGKKILEECVTELRGEIEGKSILEKKKLVEECVMKKRERSENEK